LNLNNFYCLNFQILEQYTVLSYTSLYSTDQGEDIKATHKIPGHQEKPIIKVTVIPKTKQTQTSSIFRKRKSLGKRVQCSVSNHENSVHAKNLYLVVAGSKREKVYEIKTTGSVTLNKPCNYSRDKDIPLEQISSLKLVLDSLNMDQKSKREKKKKENERTVAMFPGNSSERANIKNSEISKDCKCFDGEDYNLRNLRSPKDCVRITGRLGISQDDRYVLKCAATVNDKPG
jgi:hypothetical protein